MTPKPVDMDALNQKVDGLIRDIANLQRGLNALLEALPVGVVVFGDTAMPMSDIQPDSPVRAIPSDMDRLTGNIHLARARADNAVRDIGYLRSRVERLTADKLIDG